MHWVCIDKPHLAFSTHKRGGYHQPQLNLFQKISSSANIDPLKVFSLRITQTAFS